MPKRRRRATRFGAPPDLHYDRLTKWIGLATHSLRAAQEATRVGRCKAATISLVRAAKAVGALNSEELGLTHSDVRVSRDPRLSRKLLRDITNINYALEKTEARFSQTCTR